MGHGNDDFHIRVRWDVIGEEIIIHMLQEAAPDLCRLLVASMPFVCLQAHAMTAGDLLIAQAPIRFHGGVNTKLLSKMSVGDCSFGAMSHVGLIYGKVTEPEIHSVWGRVDESDRQTLVKVGNAVWENLMRPWRRVSGPVERRGIFAEFSVMD
jgi:hypothetical protein